MHPVSKRSLIAAAALAACAGAPAASYDWSTGTFVSGLTAPNPLAAGDVLNIGVGGNKFLDNVAFKNLGTVNHGATALFLSGGASVLNQGLWDATADNVLLYNGGNAVSFVNEGTFRKSGGTGDSLVSSGTGFVNRGTLDAASGRIAFNGGSRFENGSVFTGAGVVALTGGTNTFAGTYTAGNLQLQGGTFQGEAAVAKGLTQWSGGTIGGTWAVAAGATLQAQNGGNKLLSSATLTNQGTIAWDSGNAFFLQSGGRLVNEGTFEAGTNSSVIYNGGAAVSFENATGGTVRAKDGVALTFASGSNLVNAGTLEAAAGANLRYEGTARFDAGSRFTGAGRNVVAAGTNTWAGAFTSDNLELAGGTHVGAGAVAQGSTVFSGGTLTGTWTVAAGHTLAGADGGNKLITTGTLLNQGSLAWNSGNSLFLQSGAVLANEGLVVANRDMAFVYNGGSATTFDNRSGGTVRAAAGRTLALGNGLGFVNTGTLDAEAGAAIVVQGGAQLKDGSRFTGAGTVFADNANTFSGAQQSANLVLRSGTHTGSGALVQGGVAFTGGTLTGDWTVGAGHTLSGGDGGNKFITSGSLTNAGTVVWNSTNQLFLQSGGQVQNQGLWVANANTAIVYNGGGAPRLANTGTLRAAAGTTLTLGNGAGLVNQGGTLDAQGDIVVQGGARFESGSRFTGAGRVYADGANTFAGSYTSANLELRSGTHTGDGAVAQGRTVFSGGTLTGSWQVGPGGTLAAASGGNKFLLGTLVNQGRIEWGTTNALFLQSGGTLRNEGVVDIGAESAWFYNGGSAVAIVNTGLITKSGGAGTFTIGNGTGFVNQGTLEVASGTIALPTNFTNDGTLKGTGTFNLAGTLTNAGRVGPGASPGTLAIAGSFLQTGAGFFDVEVGTLASSDLLTITGNATLGGTLALSCWAACSLAVGDQLVILDAAGTLAGTFASVTLAGFATGAFDVIYDTAGSRVLLEVTQTVSAVPEPATWALWALAIGGWLARRRLAVR